MRDLDRSSTFYGEVLGLDVNAPPLEPERVYRETILSLPNGTGLCLQQHVANDGSEEESRTGMDHVALNVPDRESLDRWAQHLEAQAIIVDWQPDGQFGSMLVFRDPDHIQLELHSPPQGQVGCWRFRGLGQRNSRLLAIGALPSG